MEAIYVKIYVDPDNEELDELREEGMFFESIAGSLCIDRDNVEEIDEMNYKEEIKKIKKKFAYYDKS